MHIDLCAARRLTRPAVVPGVRCGRAGGAATLLPFAALGIPEQSLPGRWVSAFNPEQRPRSFSAAPMATHDLQLRNFPQS